MEVLIKGLDVLVGGSSIPALSGITFGARHEADRIDMTPINTPSLVKEFEAGLQTHGDWILLVNKWNPDDEAVHATLQDAAEDDHPILTFKSIYPGSSMGEFTFTGQVMKIEENVEIAGFLGCAITVMPVTAIVDVAARITSATVSGDSVNVFETADVITFTVFFNEVVQVTGTPRIAIVLTSGNKNANYASGSNSNKLTFTYTVAGGDISEAGTVSATSPISLNGGTIKDSGGNASTLTYTLSMTTKAVNPA